MPRELTATLFCGHLSPFGYSFLTCALSHAQLNVTDVFLPTADLCWSFLKKLKRGRLSIDRSRFDRHYAERNKQTIALVKRLSLTTKIHSITTANDHGIVRQLSQTEVLLTAAFPQIFSNEFIHGVGGSAVNFHPSYLPRCRGAHPIYWTIAQREQFGGVSSHLITEHLDAGPLICRERIDFDSHSITYDMLYQLVLQVLPSVLDQTVFWLISRPHNTIIELDLESTFFRQDQPEDHKVDWNNDELAVVSAKIRAGNAFCYLSGRKEMLNFLPPVSYSKYQERITSQVLIKCQEKDYLYIQTPRGLLMTSYQRSPIRKHHFYFRVLNKLRSYLVFRRLAGEELM